MFSQRFLKVLIAFVSFCAAVYAFFQEGKTPQE